MIHFNPNKSYDTVDIFVLYSGLEGSKKPVIQNSNGKFWISAKKDILTEYFLVWKND